jgi:hypothetical protein
MIVAKTLGQFSVLGGWTCHLQFQMVQHDEAELVLKLTTEMVADLVQNWRAANHEMRRSLASGLFEYLVYDLSKQQIVDFKLKPWIELLMQLKVTLQDNDPRTPPDSGSNTDGKQEVVCCSRRDSNPRRQVPKTCALSPELREPAAKASLSCYCIVSRHFNQ